MTTSEAFKIVLGLAAGNILDERECEGAPELFDEQARQLEAVRIVATVAANTQDE